LKDESTNNVVRDLNFDRDNPSLSDLSSNVLKPSSELQRLSCNVLSDRTPINIKSPPSSLERVINYDANFDRDNPSLSTSSLNVLLSDRTPKAIKSPPSSYNVLSDRTPNNIKSPLSSSNDIKVQQSSLSSSNETKLHQQAFNDTISRQRSYNDITLQSSSVLSPLSSTYATKSPQSSPNDIKLQQQLSSLNAPPLSSNNNNINGLNNNNAQASNDTKLSPLSNNDINNNNVLNHNNNNNNNNNKVSIMTTAPGTSRTPVVTNKTTDQVNVVVPGMIHTPKYDATSTRSTISVAHEETSELSSTRPNISMIHGASIGMLSKSWDSPPKRSKFSKDMYTSTENHDSLISEYGHNDNNTTKYFKCT
jgi:hypothetical protein